jgi:hypothetical protein
VTTTGNATEQAMRHRANGAQVPAEGDEALRDAGGRVNRLSNVVGFVSSSVAVVLAARKLSKARAKNDKLAVAEAVIGVAGVAIGIATRVRDARGRRPARG